jgi:hypothetical protein
VLNGNSQQLQGGFFLGRHLEQGGGEEELLELEELELELLELEELELEKLHLWQSKVP